MRSTVSTPAAADAVRVSTAALTMPVAMGYIPLGTVFGFLFVQAGADWPVAVVASVLVYAGAAQYMMVPMMAAGLPVGAIAVAALVVNLRHVFYGLSLLQKWPARGWARWYMVYALTDETYSVLTTLPAHTPPRQMLSLAALNHLWWVLGTALGALIGAQAKVPLVGLDFVLASLFAVLTVEQWRHRQTAAPLWVALGAYALAYVLLPGQALSVAMGLCVVAALAWRTHRPLPQKAPGA